MNNNIEKHFNTAGPVNKEAHYKIDPLNRWDFNEVMNLINNQKYFLLHAPRQSGKTSCILALRDKINAEGNYIAVYANIESARGAKNDIDEVTSAVIDEIAARLGYILDTEQFVELADNMNINVKATARINRYLRKISIIIKKPIILLIDEIDSLHGDAIISLLSQLRSGYDNRGEDFPWSIMLTGVLDIKDYRLLNIDPKHITGGSCFNVKSKSLTIGNFSRNDVEKLYLEHTKSTGQVFKDEVFDLVYDLTDGQPWLVNALAYEVCCDIRNACLDRSIAITAEMIEDAKERLILSRQTHLDQLVDKLKQERVYRVIAPIFAGRNTAMNITENDTVNEDEQYCLDLGLIKESKDGLVISNKIYQEVLPRELVFSMQRKFLSIFKPEWINEDESLNTEKLLSMFQQFWRGNSEIWSQAIKGYVEAAPHLVFQAFLQRVSNGQGKIEREYGLGKSRANLYLKWNSPMGEQRVVIELKVHSTKTNLSTVKKDGLVQTAEYADKCDATESHLIIFDRRENIDWANKIYSEKSKQNGYKIKIWGM